MTKKSSAEYSVTADGLDDGEGPIGNCVARQCGTP